MSVFAPLAVMPSETPFCVRRWSVPRLPWTVNCDDTWSCVPPTSWLMPPAIDTPGISVARFLSLRPVGIASMISWLSTRCCVVFCTSTIGDSPVTVTVSEISPTRRSALIVAENDPCSSTPSRLTLEKPPRRERHGVGAGAQVLDAVLAGVIGHRRPHFFDQRRAGRFDGHARQHRTRRVAYDAGDRGLREGQRGHQHHDQRRDNRLRETPRTHSDLLQNLDVASPLTAQLTRPPAGLRTRSLNSFSSIGAKITSSTSPLGDPFGCSRSVRGSLVHGLVNVPDRPR